jgi:hypothetical protein
MNTVCHTNTNCDTLNDTIFASAYVISHQPLIPTAILYYTRTDLCFQNLSRRVLTKSKLEFHFLPKQHAQFVVTSLKGIITERMWRVPRTPRLRQEGKTSIDMTKKAIVSVHRPKFKGKKIIYLFFELQLLNQFMLNRNPY